MTDHAPVSADDALVRLIAGNRRFASGTPKPPAVSPARRAELMSGQYPFATVLGCVDSRAPIELLFDVGVGDLLTVRSAGQALSGSTTGNVEFGVRALGTELVAVVGHTMCGAVGAALDPDRPDGPLGELIAEVAARVPGATRDDYETAVLTNLAAGVTALRALESLRLPDGRRPVVVGLLYHLDTGEISVEDDGGLAAES